MYYSGFLMPDKPEFPLLAIVVSGGHTLLLLVKSFTEIQKLGSTVDDAAGEAFDKVAKMLGLGYPGGPKIQRAAELGNKENSIISLSLILQNPFNFSFSGLKTSVLRYIQKNFKDNIIPDNERNNIAASFQDAVIRAITRNAEKALRNLKLNLFLLLGESQQISL